ncbi:aldo/keto reductase [Rhizobiaceae bacterium BDR2-2]|uniref:Aldo/keto reductase n=1 Tax=Ectorhizobium quercum TaxID=2965071 RepID=A0AAE3N3R2_9HYPH|nr:aldo/keto reductase [Ectorhizobium quercum]MCX8999402.1 aldo/keto reductase [Ectorhizobium quercum]
MEKRALGNTGLSIAPLVLGGNVFGWTIDEKQSFAVLDAFVDHGFDAIDTADIYSAWAPGNKGGESETIIGNWLKARPGMRDRVTIFTKVGYHVERGLSREWIEKSVDASLARLGIDRIDLYFSHEFDPLTPPAETLETYAKLLEAGKIAHIGASNFDAGQLGEALKVSKDENLPAYEVLQPEYNLYDRSSFDGALRDLSIREGLGVVTYYSLASGFLTGKYRSEADLGQSQRGGGIGKYLTPRGTAILKALDEVSARHAATPAEVALAWLIAREGVTAPIASATKIAHVEGFAKASGLALTAEDIAALDAASA